MQSDTLSENSLTAAPAGVLAPRDVVILAGGKGQRLMPYTMVLPKPLLPVGDMPILEIILRQLKSQGFERVMLAVNHLHRLIWSFFGEGERLGIDLAYNIEHEELGTCGPIGMCLDALAEDVLVVNGDVLTGINYREFLDFHRASCADLTIAVRNEEVAIDYGVVDLGPGGEVTGIREKPHFTLPINLGMYVLRRESVRKHLSESRFLNMTDLVELILADGGTVRAFELDAPWIDIGRTKQLQEAQELFERDRSSFLATVT